MPVSGAAGPQGHQDLLAGVQAHTLGADGVLESALSEHLKLSPAAVERCSGSATLSRRGRRRHRGAAATPSHGLGGTETPKRGATVTQLPYSVCDVSPPGAAETPEYPAHLRTPRRPAAHHPRLADAAPPACRARRSRPPSTAARHHAHRGFRRLSCAGGAAFDKVGTSRPKGERPLTRLRACRARWPPR